MSANDDADIRNAPRKESGGANWGVWLFRATLAATLLYSWWLLIYSHGIAPHHP